MLTIDIEEKEERDDKKRKLKPETKRLRVIIY